MASVYWRLFITAAFNTCSIAEWKMFDGTGTQIPTTGGTATASSVFGTPPAFPASNAFDGNPNTFWNAAATPTVALPQWIQYQFPSAVDVVSFSLQMRNDSNPDQGPRDFSLQASNDGSSWTTVYQYSGAGWATLAEVQTFTSANQETALGVAYRLLITDVAPGNSTCSIAEWVLLDASDNPIPTLHYNADSSSVFENFAGYYAFDGSSATFWDANNTPSSTAPEWLEYWFSDSSVFPYAFTIQARPTLEGQSPSVFSLQQSFDGTTWTTIDTYSADPWTTGSQIQRFPKAQPIVFIAI